MKINYTIIGIVLSCFAFFILAGIIGTIFFKQSFNVKSNEFVWTSKNAPQSVSEALDWIRVKEFLVSQGYDDEKIRTIYELRQIKRKIKNDGTIVLIDSFIHCMIRTALTIQFLPARLIMNEVKIHILDLGMSPIIQKEVTHSSLQQIIEQDRPFKSINSTSPLITLIFERKTRSLISSSAYSK